MVYSHMGQIRYSCGFEGNNIYKKEKITGYQGRIAFKHFITSFITHANREIKNSMAYFLPSI
jgi:hypothetical protein